LLTWNGWGEAVLITWNTIITAASALGAIFTIVKYYNKAHEWVERQSEQDAELKAIRANHDADVKAIKEEQAIIVYSQLACLKGLQEQGCNGPVTEAINKIEKYLNEKAHE
jgi:hypothetical protein